ncbi:MAG TPA: (2Fe-2S)-binding protein [Desulfobacteraceae bacterium]|nr:(2Fe-2S)-binding protein [Desulfobacteraceae bacterium]|tara:strand:- start:166 stop:690 length:525 start_codon:yes stop_codon:yes gene_type:complete
MQLKNFSISCKINGRTYEENIAPDRTLIEFLRGLGFLSVKQGCDTSNCGLCTVWLDGTPVLSCSMLAARANGRAITTIEGVQEEATAFAGFMAAQGADQCGFCSPGLVMNILAMERELDDPTPEDIKHYLAGNLCRCTGYASQMRAIEAYLAAKTAKTAAATTAAPAAPAEGGA